MDRIFISELKPVNASNPVALKHAAAGHPG
jgi:hypothetical protein